jgi:hypothetical protein
MALGRRILPIVSGGLGEISLFQQGSRFRFHLPQASDTMPATFADGRGKALKAVADRKKDQRIDIF